MFAINLSKTKNYMVTCILCLIQCTNVTMNFPPDFKIGFGVIRPGTAHNMTEFLIRFPSL